MKQLKSESYAGHKIWFEESSGSVNARVSIDGIWYGQYGPTKREAFHKMKILIVDILKKGNFQKHRSHVASKSWDRYCDQKGVLK